MRSGMLCWAGMNLFGLPVICRSSVGLDGEGYLAAVDSERCEGFFDLACELGAIDVAIGVDPDVCSTPDLPYLAFDDPPALVEGGTEDVGVDAHAAWMHEGSSSRP